MKRSLALIVLLVGCHRLKPQHFEATYRREGDTPQEAPECARLSKVTVRDPRPDPQLVGDRDRDGRPGAEAVTATNNVAGWVRDGIEAQLKAGKYALGDAQGPSLVVTVNTIDLHEQVVNNSNYRARVVLDVNVVLPTGQTCLNASYEGAGKNFGSDASEKNYAQTLNRALDAASVAILNAPGFRDAACSRCPSAAPPSAP